jgi:LDH2 family malate/lactate/ureidoglycolate dehydrogenase
MGSNVVHVPVEVMRQFAEDAFITLGVPEEDARICTDVLLSADLRGISSHGVGRLKVYVDRVVDGHHGMGHVIGLRAMQMAIQKAKEYGMGSVAVRNSSHFGIAGYYPLMAIQEDLIGLTVTNARPSVLPTFGGKPMFGTNPIAFGAPTDEDCPFLFDAATSVIPRSDTRGMGWRSRREPGDGHQRDSQGFERGSVRAFAARGTRGNLRRP